MANNTPEGFLAILELEQPCRNHFRPFFVRFQGGRDRHAMNTHLRTAAAIAIGVLVAVLLAYLGLIVFILATIGIPLGADPEPLTATQYGILLLLAGGAAAFGGRTATRVALGQSRVPVWGVCVTLAIAMLWGFSGRNSWPAWWGGAVATAMVVGGYIGGSLLQHRRRS